MANYTLLLPILTSFLFGKRVSRCRGSVANVVLALEVVEHHQVDLHGLALAAAHGRAVAGRGGGDLCSGPHDLLPDVLVVGALRFDSVECV